MSERSYWREPPSVGEPFFDIVATSELLDRVQRGESAIWIDDGQLPAGLDALAVIVDLEGFTSFCDQRDPQNLIPPFVRQFHEWLFTTIRRALLVRTQEDSARCYLQAPPPFFVKFLGDGYLLLFPADSSVIAASSSGLLNEDAALRDVEGDLTNLVSIFFDVRNFYPDFADHVRLVGAPTRLRVGGAMGHVRRVDVGGVPDFVGPCINSAARLQKLGKLGFAFDAGGLPVDFPEADGLRVELETKDVPVRGARTARVYVSSSEWMELSLEEQADVLGRG